MWDNFNINTWFQAGDSDFGDFKIVHKIDRLSRVAPFVVVRSPLRRWPRSGTSRRFSVAVLTVFLLCILFWDSWQRSSPFPAPCRASCASRVYPNYASHRKALILRLFFLRVTVIINPDSSPSPIGQVLCSSSFTLRVDIALTASDT